MVYPTGVKSSYGFRLIVSTTIVYVGLVVRLYFYFLLLHTNCLFQLSTAMYQHYINKLKLITRSVLVGLVHGKTMNSPSISYDNGDAISLISNDAESRNDLRNIASSYRSSYRYKSFDYTS